MRSIVTGGAGFIGSQIVDGLLADGSEVLVIDDLSTGREANLDKTHSKLHFEQKSILDDRVQGIFDSFKPEVVFHTAAQINVRRSVSEPAFDADVNVVGTVKLLEAAKSVSCKSFVFSSTGGAIYGEQEEFPASENHRINAESPYGVSKRCAELYLQYYAKTSSLQCLSLRYSNVYGPRQNPKGEAGVVAIFTERLLAGQALRVNGDGEQTRDFVFVEDVVRANLLATKSQQSFDVFNVGTARESSVLEIVELITSAWQDVSAQNKVQVEHGPPLPGEQRRSVISYKRIEKELGWTPQVLLQDGLKKTLRSYGPSES